MNWFETMILHMIYILFPLLVYLFYLTYSKNTNKKINNLFLDLTLLSSAYLCLKYTNNYFFKTTILIVNIPIIISYTRKRGITALIISALVIVYYMNMFGGYLYIFIIEYLIYFVLYLYFMCKKNLKNYYLFVSQMLMIKTLFFLIVIFLKTNNNYEFFISFKLLFILLIMFYVLTYFIVMLFNEFEEILRYHLSYKELEQDKQIRGSLFRITHEIKNPIAVCKGYLDMYDENNIDKYKKYIPIMKKEIDHTLVLLQDFLCMNNIIIEKEEIDINMLIDDVSSNLKGLMKKKGIECIVDLVDDDIYINGDYNRLTQVIINLIKNSIEATSIDGTISIITTVDNNNFKLVINDNGEGMNSDVLAHIREPFYTTKVNGTGLGVSLSYEIVEAHDGKLIYDSILGKGTTVTMLLPLSKMA